MDRFRAMQALLAVVDAGSRTSGSEQTPPLQPSRPPCGLAALFEFLVGRSPGTCSRALSSPSSTPRRVSSSRSTRPSPYQRSGGAEAADRRFDLAARETDVPQFAILELPEPGNGCALDEITRDRLVQRAGQAEQYLGALCGDRAAEGRRERGHIRSPVAFPDHATPSVQAPRTGGVHI